MSLYRGRRGDGCPRKLEHASPHARDGTPAEGVGLAVRKGIPHQSSVKSTEVYADVHEKDVERMMRRRPGRVFLNEVAEE